jgi:hypothetical protein
MGDDIYTMSERALRGTDSNTLLRLYDAAAGASRREQPPLKRARADKALRRITEELQRRNVRP